MPVAASSATSELPNRLRPLRSPPKKSYDGELKLQQIKQKREEEKRKKDAEKKAQEKEKPADEKPADGGG